MERAEVIARLSTVPAEERLVLIAQGAAFPSKLTLGQAGDTLKADEQYGHLLRTRGFREAAATDLRWLQEALRVMLLAQSDTHAEDKVTNRELLAAMKAGKKVRLEIVAVLGEARDELKLSSAEGAREAARRVEAGLGLHATAGADAELLAVQLEALATLLDLAAVKQVLELAEQPLVAQARAAATAVRAADAKTVRRAGEAQQWLDLLDGLLMRRVRQARKAARAAARELGDAQVAAAFELKTLYSKG